MTSTAAANRSPAACTIISRNYLSHARILARSYLDHHPAGRFYVLVVDGLPEGVDAGPGVRVLGPEALALPNFYELCFMYDVSELCTAVKPTFLQLLMARHGETRLLYIDPDILVMRPLEELTEPLAAARIVLTPHTLRPLPADGLSPADEDIIISGAYNLGFIGLAESDQTYKFLRWWEERLLDGGAFNDVPRGLMTDQKWIDLVPGLFPATLILRDETYNVAYWNLPNRVLEKRGGRFLVNGRPLGFFHFSAFKPTQPSALSKDQDRIKVVPGTALADLLALYVGLQMRNGYAESSRWKYGFSRFDNGVALNLPLRYAYFELDEEERERFGNPFRTGGGDSFLAWATRPQAEQGGLSPFLLSVYRLRTDLAAAFPDVRGGDRDAFLRWARTTGPGEMGYEPELADLGLEAGGNGAVGPTFQLRPGPAAGSAVLRVTPSHTRRYRALVRAIRTAVQAAVPPDATVAVVSKGDDALLRLDGRRAWHFPQTEEGEYAGYNPGTAAEAIDQLETVRRKGGDFLLFPQTALWWLEHYGEFKQHLDRRYRVVVDQKDTCLIYQLADAASG